MILKKRTFFCNKEAKMMQEELANKIGTKKAISHVLKMVNATSSFLNDIKFLSLG
jgi:hypothetical protein